MNEKTLKKPIRYEIDEAAMGGEWQGDLSEFADVLQDVAGDDWEIVAITSAHNGAHNEAEMPEAIWLEALAKHDEQNG